MLRKPLPAQFSLVPHPPIISNVFKRATMLSPFPPIKRPRETAAGYCGILRSFQTLVPANKPGRQKGRKGWRAGKAQSVHGRPTLPCLCV